MDFKSLFDSLAEYLDFLIELFQFRGMEKFSRLGHISPKLVTFSVAGLFIGYLISYIRKVPGYEERIAADIDFGERPPEISEPKAEAEVNIMDMTQFLLMSILGAFVFHGFLRVFSRLAGFPTLFTIQDTLNAVLAYNAIYHPFNALAQVSRRTAKVVAPIHPAVALFSALVLFVISVSYLLGLPYAFYMMGAAHGSTSRAMVVPFLVFVAIILVPFGLLGGFPALIRRRTRTGRTQAPAAVGGKSAAET